MPKTIASGLDRKLKNGLCIDVEGYTDISSLLPTRKEISLRNARGVLKDTVKILDILDRTNTKGTFFIIASYVKEIPDIAVEIEHRGHEIGLHGYEHRPVYSMTKDDFDQAVEESLNTLKKYISQEVIGYHAADFSLTRDTFWAFDILIKRGFRYDCSIFPVKHPNYGIEEFPRYPVCIKEWFYEIPMPTLRIFGRNIPFGGGGYLRHFPYWLNNFFFRVHNRSGHPVLTYVHPWEFEDAKDWANLFKLEEISWFKKWRYFGNCGENFSFKFERLIRDFWFVPVREVYEDCKNKNLRLLKNSEINSNL